MRPQAFPLTNTDTSVTMTQRIYERIGPGPAGHAARNHQTARRRPPDRSPRPPSGKGIRGRPFQHVASVGRSPVFHPVPGPGSRPRGRRQDLGGRPGPSGPLPPSASGWQGTASPSRTSPRAGSEAQAAEEKGGASRSPARSDGPGLRQILPAGIPIVTAPHPSDLGGAGRVAIIRALGQADGRAWREEAVAGVL